MIESRTTVCDQIGGSLPGKLDEGGARKSLRERGGERGLLSYIGSLGWAHTLRRRLLKVCL